MRDMSTGRGKRHKRKTKEGRGDQNGQEEEWGRGRQCVEAPQWGHGPVCRPTQDGADRQVRREQGSKIWVLWT